MKRKIIHIDDSLCNGCGNCIPNCPEGALQLIEGKARLVSDLFCDGLGACIGECPLGAITVEEREAEPYDERRVMTDGIIPKGEAVIRAHLEHLRGHGEQELFDQAMEALAEAGLEIPLEEQTVGCGCGAGAEAPVASELSHWPVQMHLIPPTAPYFQDADLLLAADCAGFAFGDFHRGLLRGKRLAIACPKLDSQQEVYLDKLTALIDFGGIRSLTVVTMEVPCCRGLVQLARRAAAQAERRVPLYWKEISVDGRILQEAELMQPTGVG